VGYAHNPIASILENALVLVYDESIDYKLIRRSDQRVNPLLHRLGSKVKGYITGFDRLVFKGMLQPLIHTAALQGFLRSQGVLNKDYKTWMLSQSTALVQSVEAYAQATCGQGIVWIPSLHTRKESLAHERQRLTGIRDGLIGVWACLESGPSFRAHFDRTAGFPQLRPESVRCKHLYFYYDHPVYGFLSVRLQTWLPFGIQVALNGREWLARSLDADNCPYFRQGNKFLAIDDYEKAQRHLDTQLDTRWQELLTSFLPNVFPTMKATLGSSMEYYWTVWQSEWATDLILDSPDSTAPLMEDLLRHAFYTGTGERVLRYLGHPVRPDGQPHPLAKPDVSSRLSVWHDGARIRHWADNNSVKLYNEHNVIRIETTINRPDRFKVYRHKQGQSKDEPKQRLPLRKGIADLPLRARVSEEVNQRFAAHVATFTDTTPLREVLATVQAHTRSGRSVRALDPMGKDLLLLQAIADPALGIDGITNKALQRTLAETSWAKGKTGQALSARISRHLRLLRDHGLLRKVPNQRRYQLTDKGRQLTTLLDSMLAASTDRLLQLAA